MNFCKYHVIRVVSETPLLSDIQVNILLSKYVIFDIFEFTTSSYFTRNVKRYINFI